MNCFLTASYSLTLRWVMDEAKKSTKSGSLNEVAKVLLNNLLSLPFAIIVTFLFGGWDYRRSGLIGLSISFTSMWFLHQTSMLSFSCDVDRSSFRCSIFSNCRIPVLTFSVWLRLALSLKEKGLNAYSISCGSCLLYNSTIPRHTKKLWT
ncbi:GDP-mannose transporter GONST2-like [Vicia villosa]|uniref:GDP-mannose transporter GONST2-like n=1 Tax=Vicia villosa TaxID=3911 RepID=UPI00273A865D|nr:GDP-mannose transporter GONST2-like [Vicia villosa]